MNMSAALQVGLRYSNSRKSNRFIGFINTFSISGIALGLMALIVTTSVMNGFEGQLKSRILGVLPHFVVESKQVPDALTPFLVGQTPFVELEGVLQSSDSLKPIYINGIYPESFSRYSLLDQQLIQGRSEQLQAGSYHIIIGRMLALNQDIAVGDEVRVILAGKSVFTPFGRVPAQRLFTVSGIVDSGSELDGNLAFVNLDDLAAVYRESSESLGQTRLFLTDPFDYLDVREILDNHDLKYSDWRARQGALFDAVKMEKNMMALMLMLIIAVAAFNIVSSLVMVVNEKQGDIAILRTQGMTKQGILLVFMCNGMANGIKGTAIGLVFGVLIASQLNSIVTLFDLPILQYLPEAMLPVDMRLNQVLITTLSSLFLCLAASIYPAWQAVKVQPATALRDE